jgi:regulator of protease activity HflC (stomatin/prohibitin superfamily)
VILVAEGEKESVVLRAQAKKEALITEAEGEAQAIERVYKAQALGVELLKKAAPDQAYLTLRGYETFERVANGQSTKIIIPSELQNMAGLLASVKALVEPDKEDKK